jgi:hypothetical protein
LREHEPIQKTDKKRFTMLFLDINENRAVVVKKERRKRDGSSITNEWVYGIDRRKCDDD